MKRREFFESVGCGAACFAATPVAQESGAGSTQQGRRRYEYEIEIVEAREDTWCHHRGDTFQYPDEYGQICTWLRGSLDKFIAALENGAVLPWRYEGTPYEKVIDLDGVTTEYVRCPDPTANLVAKITRTAVG